MSRPNPLLCDTPARILELLRDVPGNDAVKRAVACSITISEYNFTTINKNEDRDIVSFTPLFIGPSRSGKSCIVKEAGNLIDKPHSKISLTEVSPHGWHGKCLQDHLYQLKEHNGGLLVLELCDLDNISINGDRDGYYRRVQLSLIKLLRREIEGTEAWSIFITGRFNETEECVTDRSSTEVKLRSLGIIPQLIEQLSPIVFLKRLSDIDLMSGIEADPMVRQVKQMYAAIGENFSFSELEQELIAAEFRLHGNAVGQQLVTNMCIHKLIDLPSCGVLLGTEEEKALFIEHINETPKPGN